MDIICAKCGRHFSSIEAAREHRGHCKETSEGESIRWIPARKSKITPEEWEKLINLINNQDVSQDMKPSELEPKSVESESSKESTKPDDSISNTNSKNIHGTNQKHKAVKDKKKKTAGFHIKNWMIALLFIFAFSVVGLGISIFTGIFLPFWILFGFSLIFSIEKWFSYVTRKHKFVGKLYKLLLNLSILAILGILIWSGIKLFSGQFVQSSLVGSLIFLAELVFFIWMWRVISKNRWRWPSMKLTVFSLICLFVIFAFSGVKPFSDYKYSIVSRYTEWRENTEQSRLEKEAAAKAEAQERVKEAIVMMPIPLKEAPTTTQTESPLTTTPALKTEQAEKEAFKLINTIRENAGIPATKWNDELYKLSKQHTQAMADKGELFHTPLGASTGENAWGGTGYYHYQYDELAKVIVDSWMSSPLHKAWLLHAPITESVVSIVIIPNGQYASWSFWMNSFDRGPELIEKVVAEWKASGSSLDWIPWLQSKGYLK
jgi:uncharacterized protein YkwD